MPKRLPAARSRTTQIGVDSTDDPAAPVGKRVDEPDRSGDRTRSLLRASASDLATAGAVMVWIGTALAVDRIPLPAAAGGEVLRQVLLGSGTWALLLGLSWREPVLTRIQTGVVVVLATLVEYTFSPLLEAYVYRIGTVPAFVPPGHGLVYLAALCLGRSAWMRAVPRASAVAVAVVGGIWAGAGLLGSPRPDQLGAFWYACLLGFLAFGRSRGLYVGAFVVVSYLELLGTALGTWAWAPRDPLLGEISQGNPPSGAAGGYGWFDLYAMVLAPRLLRLGSRFRR